LCGKISEMLTLGKRHNDQNSLKLEVYSAPKKNASNGKGEGKKTATGDNDQKKKILLVVRKEYHPLAEKKTLALKGRSEGG